MNPQIQSFIKSSDNLLNSVLDWLAPKTCINCAVKLDNSSYPCCTQCSLTLPFQTNACRRCGQAFAATLDYCGRCLANPPPFDACFCAFRYQAPVDEQIRRFKYGDRPELAALIATLLSREIESNLLERPELLIPVPVHISKLRERGFNQSLLLAKQLSKLLDVPYANNIVTKNRATPPQVQQTLKFRQKNLTGSFKLKSPVSAKSVAIIDDVVTTGSTAAEMTKILKRNGVDYIQVWGVAHTV